MEFTRKASATRNPASSFSGHGFERGTASLSTPTRQSSTLPQNPQDSTGNKKRVPSPLILEAFCLDTPAKPSPTNSVQSPFEPRAYRQRFPNLPTSTPSGRKQRHASQKSQLIVVLEQEKRSRHFYFTADERDELHRRAVIARGDCQEHHSNCTDCFEIEYTDIANRTMPTSIAPEERQKIISNNRSLRTIKTVSPSNLPRPDIANVPRN